MTARRFIGSLVTFAATGCGQEVYRSSKTSSHGAYTRLEESQKSVAVALLVRDITNRSFQRGFPQRGVALASKTYRRTVGAGVGAKEDGTGGEKRRKERGQKMEVKRCRWR